MNYGYQYPSAKIIKDTNAHNGRFGKVLALEDSVIAVLLSENIDGATTTITLNANCSLEGVITRVKLTSGSVIAYRL